MQLPVVEFLKRRLRVSFVDVVTEPGAVRVLADRRDRFALKSITRRLELSLEVHAPRTIAVAAHHDCRANQTDDERQQQQLVRAVQFLGRHYGEVAVLGLWVNFAWAATEWCLHDRDGTLVRYG